MPPPEPSATDASVATTKPPRPPNAWILYRSDKLREYPRHPKRAQADISKDISALWRKEKEPVKSHYEHLAELAKAEHLRMYPGYRFAPVKKAEKERLREEKRLRKEQEREAAKKARVRPSPYPVPMIAMSSSQVGPSNSQSQEFDLSSYSPPMAFAPLASDSSSGTPSSETELAHYFVGSRLSALAQTSTVPASTSAASIPSVSLPSTAHKPFSSHVVPYAGGQTEPMPALPARLLPSTSSSSEDISQVLPEPSQPPSSAPTPSTGSEEGSSNWPYTPESNGQLSFQEAPSIPFTFPQFDMDSIQNYPAGNDFGPFDSGEFGALLNSTGDPSIFQLDGVSAPDGSQDPPANIDLDLANVPQFSGPVTDGSMADLNGFLDGFDFNGFDFDMFASENQSLFQQGALSQDNASFQAMSSSAGKSNYPTAEPDAQPSEWMHARPMDTYQHQGQLAQQEFHQFVQQGSQPEFQQFTQHGSHQFTEQEAQQDPMMDFINFESSSASSISSGSSSGGRQRMSSVATVTSERQCMSSAATVVSEHDRVVSNTSTHYSGASSYAPSPVASQQQSSQAYMPPPGAMNASSRRVGGKWQIPPKEESRPSSPIPMQPFNWVRSP